MELSLRIFVILVGVLILSRIIRNLKTKRISESDSLLWIFVVGVLFLIGIWPTFFNGISKALGIEDPMTLILVAALCLIIIVCFRNSNDISTLTSKNLELAIHVTLLNRELVDLRNKVNEHVQEIGDVKGDYVPEPLDG